MKKQNKNHPTLTRLPDEDKLLKMNAIKLARHHRKYCEGEKCDISLILIATILQKAGIKLTDKEFREFM